MARAASTYASLRSAVRKMLREGDEAGTAKRVTRYYRIGDTIVSYVLAHGGRAEYGKETVKRRADDLVVGYQRLYEMLSVRRAYPIFRPAGKLTWAHYVALAGVEDERVRETYETQAAEASWSRRMLRDRIKERMLEAGAGDRTVAPKPRRGVPYTYRVKEASRTRLLLDLGMGAKHALDVAQASSFEPGDVVKTRHDGSLYGVETGEKDKLYTFRAVITRVVDGDTFWAQVDYGFRFYQPWKVRLRGMDAPELPTADGEMAKAWLEERLNAQPFVVMTTTKVGMYGRYIADVFYGGGRSAAQVAKRGKYLNGEMVKEGVASRM